jgi:hypothetical protein
VRVFISQASRNAAHNLDDLSERWQLRREREKYSVWVPPSLPTLETISDVMFFRAELLKIRMGIDTELGLIGKHASHREQLLKWSKHVQKLQIELKGVMQRIESENGGAAYAMIKELIRKGQLSIEGGGTGYTVIFPTIQQTVFVPKLDLSEWAES